MEESYTPFINTKLAKHRDKSCIRIGDLKPSMSALNLCFMILKKDDVKYFYKRQEVCRFLVGDETGCLVFYCCKEEESKLLNASDIVKVENCFTNFRDTSLCLYMHTTGRIYKFDEFCMDINEKVNISEPGFFEGSSLRHAILNMPDPKKFPPIYPSPKKKLFQYQSKENVFTETTTKENTWSRRSSLRSRKKSDDTDSLLKRPRSFSTGTDFHPYDEGS